jgi:hypothetical protein
MTQATDAGPGTQECKRPGCGNLIPPGAGRGRHRVFCSDDCARRYHNDARIPAPIPAASGDGDALAALEQALRQAAVLARAARDQAAALDPARVRADIADAEAGRRRAEAAAVTAQARQAEAEAEAQALAEALQAARDDATRFQRERDGALTTARDARTAADAETARARQAETDARDETRRAREDAARERDALRDSHAAQLEAQRALTDAERARAERAEAQLETERADRRQLTSHITGNGTRQPPAPTRTGARSK